MICEACQVSKIKEALEEKKTVDKLTRQKKLKK
jgi:hypothetical protein